MMDPVIVEQRREVEIVTDTSGTTNVDAAANGAAITAEPLFPQAEAENLRKRWEQIQSEFVDDPRDAVAKADRLVADTIKRLTDVFAEQRTRLEHEWDKGDTLSTEDLRQAFRKYRSFFDRLLSAGSDPLPAR